MGWFEAGSSPRMERRQQPRTAVANRVTPFASGPRCSIWATIDATASDKAWICLSLPKSTAPAMPHIRGLPNDPRSGQTGRRADRLLGRYERFRVSIGQDTLGAGARANRFSRRSGQRPRTLSGFGPQPPPTDWARNGWTLSWDS